MILPAFFRTLVNMGVRDTYLPWENYLARKLNLVSILGFCNVLCALVIFTLVGYYKSIPELLTVLVISPFVFILNKRFGYVAAVYHFNFIGCFLFYFLAVKMGQDSFAFMYYFPLMIGVIQMVGRRETLFHMISLLMMCLVSVILTVISYRYNFFKTELSAALSESIRYVNIIFTFTAGVGFMIIISMENIRQEKQLSVAIQQKEVLLAELFHRVKNNLNIVTSLLNLKKDSIDSKEAQAALEECRNLIFSMALVHDKIYKSDNIDNLNLKEYISTLSTELLKSMHGQGETEFDLKSENVNLHISKAIPCGLIINELITNSFKHARQSGKILSLRINIELRDNKLCFVYSDNGPGLKADSNRKNSLGLDLINSLCEQLEAENSFTNLNGLVFTMCFEIGS